MSKSTKTLLFVTLTAVAAVAAYAIVQRSQQKRKLRKVSNEGYETAMDIMYPDHAYSAKLKYGPVLPE